MNGHEWKGGICITRDSIYESTIEKQQSRCFMMFLPWDVEICWTCMPCMPMPSNIWNRWKADKVLKVMGRRCLTSGRRVRRVRGAVAGGGAVDGAAAHRFASGPGTTSCERRSDGSSHGGAKSGKNMGKIGVILVVLKSFGGVDVMTCHD